MGAHPGVFVIKPDGTLAGLSESPYESEDLLQGLLARYPGLLAGHEIDPEAPRRWLLVARELGVPDQEAGPDRWSLDHLFLDQDGVPTLVEVKRSSDTRIRREVVGQMLDYAANGVVHWPVERIQSAFDEQCDHDGRDAEAVLRDFLGPELAAEQFWTTVKTNLQAGKLRLLFVSDEIPSELRRVVEFLNEQMDPAEVLALEITQFVGEGLRTLMPRVIGQTASAVERKSSTASVRGPRWTEATFFEKLAGRGNAEEARVARALFDWASATLTRVEFGSGLKTASFVPVLEGRDGWFGPFRVYAGERAYVEIPLGGSSTSAAPLKEPERRLEYARRLNGVPGIRIREELDRFPSFDLLALAEGDRLQRFVEIATWAANLVKAASRAS